jgi:hypothetical protein
MEFKKKKLSIFLGFMAAMIEFGFFLKISNPNPDFGN